MQGSRSLKVERRVAGCQGEGQGKGGKGERGDRKGQERRRERNSKVIWGKT